MIGHEYTHAISNRMIAGPDSNISSSQGGAMGESWSDRMAMEYLFESGYVPRGNTPYVTGAYVTGDLVTGIRNFDMSASPLNYSDIGYDRFPAVHSDGEIWSATNFDIRRSMIAGTAPAPGPSRRAARTARHRRPSARATGAGRSWCSTRSCSPPPGRSACWTCATT